GGSDTLSGGKGRSILIGGTGDDTLTGGPSGDILIQGTTSFDSNLDALLALLAEWQSSDSFTTRAAALRAGSGLAQGNALVWGSTVLDDGASNHLTGFASTPTAGDFDWFFADQGAGHDILAGTQSGDAFT